MADREPFAVLRTGALTWAVGAVHGDSEKLRELHAHLEQKVRPGDNLVYLGNLLGRGENVAETIAEALTFRTAFLAKQGSEADGVIFLRGSQEEMWQKLLNIQFAPNPTEVLEWMIANGIEPTLNAYGGNSEEGLVAAREGIMSLIQWTNGLRDHMRKQDGHNAMFSALKRAAYVEDCLLFVHAGIDPQRPLSEQLDSFWWGGHNFDSIDKPYSNFKRIVRGYDQKHQGVKVSDFTLSLDGGCGFGGTLVAGCFEPSGDLIDRIEV
jgi:serine/threonine protein phosphatase 1